jgi:DNA-directed RNA polymerase subunit RPC12/RpoP
MAKSNRESATSVSLENCSRQIDISSAEKSVSDPCKKCRALMKGRGPDTKEVNGLAVHFRGNIKIGVKG